MLNHSPPPTQPPFRSTIHFTVDYDTENPVAKCALMRVLQNEEFWGFTLLGILFSTPFPGQSIMAVVM